MKLSIIIPAYNADRYIESCLSSCYAQDLEFSDYEVIIVNDGSTDHTEKKARSFAEKYPNIRIKSQVNMGHGAARNTGVPLSNGDYLYFLDADDYIAKNTLGTLIKFLSQHNLDILSFKSKNVSDDSFINSKDSAKDLKLDPVLNGIDFLGSHKYGPEVWRYIIKRSFYVESKLFFYNRKFVQDSFFTPTLISKAERILSVNYDVHRYRSSNDSITKNKSDDHLKIHLEDMCFAVQKLYSLRQDLISKDRSNTKASNNLHIKQQIYVFIIIARFMKSNFKISKLKPILSNFKTIEAYPLTEYKSTLSYKAPLNLILTSIFNNEILLYPLIHSFRFFKNLKAKFS